MYSLDCWTSAPRKNLLLCSCCEGASSKFNASEATPARDCHARSAPGAFAKFPGQFVSSFMMHTKIFRAEKVSDKLKRCQPDYTEISRWSSVELTSVFVRPLKLSGAAVQQWEQSPSKAAVQFSTPDRDRGGP